MFLVIYIKGRFKKIEGFVLILKIGFLKEVLIIQKASHLLFKL